MCSGAGLRGLLARLGGARDSATAKQSERHRSSRPLVYDQSDKRSISESSPTVSSGSPPTGHPPSDNEQIDPETGPIERAC